MAEVSLDLRIRREIEVRIDVVGLAAFIAAVQQVMVPGGIDHALHHRLGDARVEAQIPRFVEQVGVVERRQVTIGQPSGPFEDARGLRVRHGRAMAWNGFNRPPATATARGASFWTARRQGMAQADGMSIIMHDLAGADPDLRFSPYCWRIRFALAHKGLPVETIPWRFTETEAIAFSGQARVPVIRDGDKVVFDSWSIAEYLEETCPAPAIFGGPIGRSHALFINAWADSLSWSAASRDSSCATCWT
jgi:hypothetical protein